MHCRVRDCVFGSYVTVTDSDKRTYALSGPRLCFQSYVTVAGSDKRTYALSGPRLCFWVICDSDRLG